jgi:hypothetical protein
MDQERLITKVKYKPTGDPYIQCEWEDEDGNEHSVKVKGPIHPDLKMQFQKLRQHFINVLNFGHLLDQWKRRWKVTALERQGTDAVKHEMRVTAHYRIEGGSEKMETLSITTPWRIIPADMKEHVDAVLEEAELVIDEAKTAQQAMFDGTSGDGTATDEPSVTA